MIRLRRLGSKLVVALLIVCLLAQPIGAAAAPIAIHDSDNFRTLAPPGLEYLDSFALTLQSAATLIPRLSALTSGSPTQPTVGELTIARDDLESLGMQSAELIGRIDSMLEALSGISELNGQAVDVGQIALAGIPQELQNGLVSDIGYTVDQVAHIDQAFQHEIQERYAIQEQGLPQELQDFLLEAGYSAADIQSIETSIASQGITQASLTTRADQLLASRDDLALLRAGAHILYVQLVGTEITARQRAGDSARSLAEEELQELAKDELRLLIHAAHIQSQLDHDQNDIGEGEFWFIERYAGRAAERLEALVLETQNYGLAVELFLLLELQSIAAEARFGANRYAADELEIYAGLLAEITGTNSFFAQQKQHIPGLFARVSVMPFVRDHFAWPLSDSDIDHVAKLAKLRFENNPYQELFDDFPENDSLEVLLVAGYSGIEAISRLWHLFVLPLSEHAIDLLALLLGFRDPQNTEEMMALIVISLIPVLDILNDLITFMYNPSTFVKVIAVVGIFLSLGEITAFLFPGAIALGPPAVVADSMATGVRTVYTGYGDATAKAILDQLDDPEAILWVTDLMRSAGRRLVADGVDLADEGVPAVRRALLDSNLYDDFLSYARVAGNLDILGEGVDEGALFIGRVSRQDEVVEGLLDLDFQRQLKEWGNELFDQGIDVSDDAAGGVARAAKEVGQEGVERLRRGLQHANGDYIDEELEFALDLIRRAGFEWTDEALEGVGRSTRLVGIDGTQRLFDLGEDSREAFAAIALRGEEIWDEATGEGLARLFEKGLSNDILAGRTQSEYYLDILSTYSDDVSEDVLRLLNQGDPTSASHLLQRSTDPRDILQWRFRGNTTDFLQEESIQLLRKNMDSAEYDSLKHTIFDRWNDGQEMPIEQLREAFGVEGPIWLLQKQYPQQYEVVWVNTKRGIQGPDAVLWDQVESRWVILEGKGTSQVVTELTGDMFPQTQTLGRQLSLQWIITHSERYIDSINDQVVRARVQDMVDQLSQGALYDAIIGRGGIRPQVLDYGSGLDNFLSEIKSASLVNIQFLFVASP